ncbi:hypothetical protein QL285_016887 [Trifolium repens]|nr:hypothetical protein QL285_016887 [Trifolium repens]
MNIFGKTIFGLSHVLKFLARYAQCTIRCDKHLKQEEAEEEGFVAENAGIDDVGVDVGNAAVGNGVDVTDGDAVMNDDVEAGGDTEELERLTPTILFRML